MKPTNYLNDLVGKLLEQHEGGTAFFDALDESVREPNLFNSLFRLVAKDFPTGVSTILSGQFGRYIVNILTASKQPIYGTKVRLILVNGGLRHGAPIDDLKIISDTIKDTPFVFLDDSLYKGRTRDAIQAEIERWGGYLAHTYVIYDGSKEKDPSVSSLYRYWDHHE